MTDFNRGAPPPANGMAIASLVLGIVSVLIVWIPIVGILGTAMALIGLVLGILSLRRLEGRGLAIGGIVCAGISLVISALYMAAIVAMIASAASLSA